MSDYKSENKLLSITDIDNLVNYKKLLDISFFDGKKSKLYVHRLVYIDGKLSIVGEEYIGRCLVYFPLGQVVGMDIDHMTPYIPNFCSAEMDDFISAIRAINGSEVRLVLKVRSDLPVDFTPKHHFIGKPYMTTNVNGDIIWGGFVEVSNDLLDWLFTFYDRIEILAPITIRRKFLDYCEKKLREEKYPLKKVS